LSYYIAQQNYHQVILARTRSRSNIYFTKILTLQRVVLFTFYEYIGCINVL